MPQRLIDTELMPEQMKGKFEAFMQNIQHLGELIKVDLQSLQADHIAMRINDMELAKLAHDEWLKEGRELSTATINGRPIIVIELAQPLKALGWSMTCLELPYPALGKLYPTQGWEHVEFVVPSLAKTAKEYLVDIKRRYPSLALQWDKLDMHGIKVKLSSPKGEGERISNPTIAFKHQGICVKFHPHSLKKIVESEHSA
ncbi:VOC family protein [Vibrio zhanjiangensis]|uniref:VOC family protein n=1 Tax=Vibrio zhanjiangensis TaxID=1046128 RepID=A0ABQ6EX45_9VIBR|nr:VOC family protein [Vibrio zhanjiangensis]GLT17404.1 VOC family protein [Vibrio zhanjiangensis]